jgi:hypothetical protein
VKDIHKVSSEELDRATMLQRVINKTLTQKDVARSLGMTDRQVRRLMVKYRTRNNHPERLPDNDSELLQPDIPKLQKIGHFYLVATTYSCL